MSDALCGPSNALQNFQKHASVDRTLQQDRLIPRGFPSQSFRSQTSNQGTLDPEFAAFESNSAGAPLPTVQHAGQFATPTSNFAVSSPAEASSWAADFRKMHISGPTDPLIQRHGPSASVAAMSAISQQDWQNEFARQQMHQPPDQNIQPQVSGLQSSYSPHYPIHNAIFAPTQESKANQQLPAEAFDEPAFEAAFEQARVDMILQEAQTTQTQAEYVEEGVEPLAVTEETAEKNIKIGSDTISQADTNDPQGRVNNADELARTAGQLLDSVKHDQSQKFRESNFLALMRRIRDREVHIDGDKFREVSTSP
ncbi:peroxin 20 [Aspergillus heteromorphus CBS 117.55]|uniref:Peroxin 20 n=1 Tax=Aspergillus heteromorphus CBS 117.55 TaxID=1448321 RepID=A0A317WKS4_9EURO|nr:peroxin 20 [Aspergillus heteromorphus CBS 117.55]PWY86311.1 peroxin 20 [Aspergillus heteromorphus CBS 117.55]